MIIITGAAGFIGSVVASGLKRAGKTNLVLVDDFRYVNKSRNWASLEEMEKVDRAELGEWLRKLEEAPEAIIHLGARTDTAETDWNIFLRLNLDYTKMIWKFCTEKNVPLVYASSAATYGGGEHGFVDSHDILPQLRPLNPYGESKHQFDQWALAQADAPPFWAGLKFFNVYGPNEYHKGRMASVFFHAFKQIEETDAMKLFRSHREGIADGHQKRDFVYVFDILKVIQWLLEARPESGLYNLGSGQARTFLDLVGVVFHAMEKEEQIQFIDTPIDIRDTYQYFTQADMSKLHNAGYDQPFTRLEVGGFHYVVDYLKNNFTY